MSGFSNAIIGGAEVLIRSAMRSANWVANTSGWKLSKDGLADLNSANLRGALEVDGANNSKVIISTAGGTGFGTAFVKLHPPDLPLIASSAIGDGQLFALSNEPSGAGITHDAIQQLEMDGPGWSFGSGVTDLRYPVILLTSPTFDSVGNPSIYLGFAGAALSPTTANITLDGNVSIKGKFALPNCTLSYQGTPVATGGAPAILTPTGVLQDTTGMYNGTTGIVAPVTGVYEIGCCVEYQAQAVAAGLRDFRYAVNAVDINHWNQDTTANYNNTSITLSGSQRKKLNIGDVVTFKAFQNSGGALNLQAESRGWVALVERTA